MPSLRFSVVIPTCHRPDLLARCLDSLQPAVQLAAPATCEVIVSDDSPEGTARTLLHTRFPWAHWAQGPSRGPAANRNNGARVAVGEWLCFIDDDCVADKNWLVAIRDATTNGSLDLLEGRTAIPNISDNPFRQLVYNREGGAYWSCNLAVRRETFAALGGFDEDFFEAAYEDMEFAHRFHACGHRSRFDAAALVYHPARMIGWRGIWKRLFLVRWEALYQFKLDQHLHLADSTSVNLLRAAKGLTLNYLRLTRDDLQRWNSPYWRIRWFGLLLRWATYPLVLPYYLYWVHRFHAQLNAKRSRLSI